MILTLKEIFYFIILTAVVGYIFTGMFSRSFSRFNWQEFKFAAMISAPGIILHELAHKFTAMGYGLNATFEIFPFGLALGVILRVFSAPFLIIAPGYVVIPLIQDEIAYRLIAFAGPLTNLILFFISALILKYGKINTKYMLGLALFKKLNLVLFFFNMIPFGPIDGAKVIFGP